MKNRVGYILPLLVLLFAANIFCGSVYLGISETIAALTGSGSDTVASYIILQCRLPQALTALFAGAALSVSGLLLQTLFHNPLAGPSVLGINSGASLGVAIVIMTTAGTTVSASGSAHVTFYILLVVAAMAGALGVTVLLLILSNIIRNNLVLLITGMMTSYIISSIITLITYTAADSGVKNYVVWGMGDYSLVSAAQLPWLAGIVCLVITLCFPLCKSLNAFQLGGQYATSLGISVSFLRSATLLITGILTAIVTAFCGPVSFIGLAVPHISRLILKSESFPKLFLHTVVMGATVSLLCSLMTTAFTTTPLPLAAVTPLIGAPVILWVLFGKKIHN